MDIMCACPAIVGAFCLAARRFVNILLAMFQVGAVCTCKAESTAVRQTLPAPIRCAVVGALKWQLQATNFPVEWLRMKCLQL